MRISDWSSDVCSSDLAEEFPDDAECDTDDNIAVASDYGMLYGEAAGEPTVGLQVGGQGFVKEDAQTDVSITAGTNSVGATLSHVVIPAPAGWVLYAVAGGQIASVAAAGPPTLTLTPPPGRPHSPPRYHYRS